MSQHAHPFGDRRWYTGFLLSLMLIWFVSPAQAAATAAEIPAVVATVQDLAISAEDLTAALQGDLTRLEIERYQLLKRKLDEMIADRLIQLEASKRGKSPQQLEQEEILAKVAPVSAEQVKAFYEANKNRLRQPLNQVAPRIEAYLQQQQQQQQRQVFLKEMRRRYTVTVALRAPQIDVDADDDPFIGPAQAPVTLIEFSDFQCPHCRRVQPTLKRLLHEYEGMIKLVFRDFPLRNIHPQAQKAAEAAQCAAEQEQFWPYHDKLFATSSLAVQDLKQYAQELGLDTERFGTCLDSDRYAREVEDDFQDGLKVGVNSTPSFFVNGQPVRGAIGYDRFQALIDAALEQAQSGKQSHR
ncbi:hypothetical protein NKDENANG_03165 [Candidatus Entotheonellaceae bacterium PAL068K]